MLVRVCEPVETVASRKTAYVAVSIVDASKTNRARRRARALLLLALRWLRDIPRAEPALAIAQLWNKARRSDNGRSTKSLEKRNALSRARQCDIRNAICAA